MDPDANLQEQERIIRRRQGQESSFRTRSEDRARLAELRRALTFWITAGGFPPEWTRAPFASAFFAVHGLARITPKVSR